MIESVTPEQMMDLATATAEDGLAAGELPIGAVVAMGDEVIGRAFTRERTERRRLVHADLLAMIEADRALGWRRRPAPLWLAVTLEPCLMCLGAAMSLGVSQVAYGLESPGDGAAGIAATWRPAGPAPPGYAVPALTGGVGREACRELFGRYCRTAPAGPLRDWAQTLAAPT